VDIAIEEIVKNKGMLYDSNVVNACKRIYKAEGEKAFLQDANFMSEVKNPSISEI
jgi:hypothetical protein